MQFLVASGVVQILVDVKVVAYFGRCPFHTNMLLAALVNFWKQGGYRTLALLLKKYECASSIGAAKCTEQHGDG